VWKQRPRRSKEREIVEKTGPLIAIALALVAGAGCAHSSHAPRADSAQRALQPHKTGAETACTGPTQAPPPATTRPAPFELTRLLGVLRRTGTPADQVPEGATFLMVRGVNPAATRLAYTDERGLRYYLVPAENIRYQPPLPNTPACKRFRLHVRPQSGVCLVIKGRERDASASCNGAKAIRTGFSLLSTTRHASGVVPDGVTAVSLRIRHHGRHRTITVRVHSNVFTARYVGGLAGPPREFFHTSAGVKAVGAMRPTRRQRVLRRRSAAHDRNATASPSVIPLIGRPRTTFTFRIRISSPRPNDVYVVKVRGPGLCLHALDTSAAPQTRRGDSNGLIKVGIGYGALGRSAWCRGRYRGTIAQSVSLGVPVSPTRVIGRFGFEVR
jgi:hypothetical protein